MLFGRSKESPLIKKLRKMQSNVAKGKSIKVPETRSREEIITEIFTEDLEKVGIQPSLDSGYIPSSQTPLARYLRKFGVVDDIIDAILTGLVEEENEVAVREIIEAAAETPEIDLHGEYLTRAQDLAVEEWEKRKQISGP